MPEQLRRFAPYRAKKGEDYMSPQQVAHFRKLLVEWKGELSGDLADARRKMQDEPDVLPDPNDRASQETDLALELRNQEREGKLIGRIDAALARIDAGDYGYCQSCGVEIGLARLEARPTATLCIDCKTLEELREKQRSP